MFSLFLYQFNVNTIQGYSMAISNGDYWTSGSDLNCENKFFWCSKESEFVKSQVLWKAGHPDANAGDCVYVEVRKGAENGTVLATNDCSQKLHYVCETRKRASKFDGLTFECMDLWDVSEGLQNANSLESVLYI
jgi:hypothetical protein